MKKIIWVFVIAAIVGFIAWSNNPLDDTMNFIVGGSIPGTKNSVGFWPMIGVIALILLIIRRVYKNLQFQMLEHTAKEITTEKAKQAFADANTGDTIEFDRSQRSVIAAPHKSVL